MMTYAELMKRSDAPPGSSWGLFGRDDEYGTLNFLTDERVRAAAACIRRGTCFNLDHTLDAFDPPIARHRHNLSHKIFGNSPHHRDDYVDGFYLQSSSQIDGLRHFRHPRHGLYNGIPDERITPDGPTLGINRFAERGIVGRGVLLDIDRHLRRQGRSLDHGAGEAFPASLLDEVAAAQGVVLSQGDILLMRTGWLTYYFHTTTEEQRRALPQQLCSPGLMQSHSTLAWLWDHRIAVAASDNAGVEAIPPIPDSPFTAEVKNLPGVNPHHAALMHPYLIAMLGLVLGELWDLDRLAEDCAKDGVYECMVIAKPLNLTGGVGSPANAIAIK